MVLVVLLISPRALTNAIDHLAIIESYLFLLYIPLLQFPTILFTLSNDPIITSPNRDSTGLISYLLTNIRSSKVSCGIKAVVYNKRGDRFSLLRIAFSHRFVPRSPMGFNAAPLSFRFTNLFKITANRTIEGSCLIPAILPTQLFINISLNIYPTSNAAINYWCKR